MNTKIIISVALLMLSFISQVNAQVDEIDESEFEDLNIVCPNKVDRRTLSFNTETSLWCGSIVTNYCKPEKVKAAYHVCTRQYASKLKQLSVMPNQKIVKPSSADVLKESISESKQRLELEEELLGIKQELLEVKRRKLELDRKTENINSSLQTDNL